MTTYLAPVTEFGRGGAPFRASPRTTLLGLLALLVAIVIAFSTGGLTAHAASTPKAPKDLTLNFHSKNVSISWDAAIGATKYYVDVIPANIHQGPRQTEVTTTGTSTRISYSDFPYNTSSLAKPYLGGWTIRVTAANSAGKGGVASSTSKVNLTWNGSLVKTKSDSALAKKINACISQGLQAGIVTGTVAIGVSVVAIWVPGVGEAVTAGALVATIGDAVVTGAVCMASS